MTTVEPSSNDFLRVHLPDAQTKVIRKSPNFTVADVIATISSKIGVEEKLLFVTMVLSDGSILHPSLNHVLDSVPFNIITVCKKTSTTNLLDASNQKNETEPQIVYSRRTSVVQNPSHKKVNIRNVQNRDILDSIEKASANVPEGDKKKTFNQFKLLSTLRKKKTELDNIAPLSTSAGFSELQEQLQRQESSTFSILKLYGSQEHDLNSESCTQDSEENEKSMETIGTNHSKEETKEDDILPSFNPEINDIKLELTYGDPNNLMSPTIDGNEVKKDEVIRYRRRTTSSASASSSVILKRQQLNRSRSRTKSSNQLDTSSVIVEVELNDKPAYYKTQPEALVEDFLDFVCTQNNITSQEYTLTQTDGTPMEMDRQIQNYFNTTNPTKTKFKVVKGTKTYGAMVVNENGKDVMVYKMQSGHPCIMAATLDKLVERITIEQDNDPELLNTVLLTYRAFMKPFEFFDYMIAQFNAELPESPSSEDCEYFKAMKPLTQKRIAMAFRVWAEFYWHDFALDADLRTELDGFITDMRQSKVWELEMCGEEIQEIAEIQNKKYEEMFQKHALADRKGKMIDSIFLDSDPAEIARQLCLLDFKLFCEIQPTEYLETIWPSRGNQIEAPSLNFFVQRFDKESYWVATEIVNIKDLKKRITALKNFITIAKSCLDYNNFFSTFAIFSGLNLSPVQRLKKTWEGIGKTRGIYEELERFADPGRNMKNYRELLTRAKPPIVPFLPIYLKDLTFINDGNKTHIEDMINVEKLRMLRKRVNDITQLGSTPYSFPPNPPVANYLSFPPIDKHMDNLKKQSVECEK